MPDVNDEMRRLRSMERFPPDERQQFEPIKPAKAFDPSQDQLDRIEAKLDVLKGEVETLNRERRLAELARAKRELKIA